LATRHPFLYTGAASDDVRRLRPRWRAAKATSSGEKAVSSFSEREKAFEAKFKNDQELQFKVNNRRNRLLGEWAAEQMGIGGDEAAAYAKTVVAADFDKPGHDDVIEKLMADFTAHGTQVSEHQVRRQADELLTVAMAQIQAESD
jgi:hypothetical protein